MSSADWTMKMSGFMMVVLSLSLSLNCVMSGVDYDGYRVLREGLGSFSYNCKLVSLAQRFPLAL